MGRETAADHAGDSHRRYSWQRIVTIARSHRRELVLAQIIAIAGALFAVPLPLLMPLLVDEVLLHKPGPTVAFINSISPAQWHGPVLYILTLLALSLLLRALSVGLQVWQAREFTIISKDITYRIRRDLLGHLEHVSMAEYELLGSGAVASHLVTDVDAVDGFLGASLSKFMVAVLTIVGVASVLLWLHWQLALFILLLNPVVIYLTTVLGRRVKQLKWRENSAFELFQQSLTETLDAMQQVRSANREGHFFKRLQDSAAAVRHHSVAYAWRSDAANRFSFVVFLFGFDLFRALSMLMVVFSDLSIGQMMAVFGYLWFMMGPVQEILNMQFAWAGADAALGRINKLFELHREPDYPALADPFTDQPSVSLTVRDIHFAYGDGPPVLDGLNMHVDAGERVALVGASGGGKSTLAQVILGLYPASQGQVLFGDEPLERIGLQTVRANVVTVLQQPALFNATVAFNLGLGRELPEQALWQALEIAQLRPTVEQLPQGLATMIGRQGVRLSGGQRQRLAIARMVLSNPKLVILDEATSSLDTTTEAALHQSLQQFLAGRTTLIIAHRLSAVRQADRVYVFDAGRIIEEGVHEELVTGGGVYQQLYGPGK